MLSNSSSVQDSTKTNSITEIFPTPVSAVLQYLLAYNLFPCPPHFSLFVIHVARTFAQAPAVQGAQLSHPKANAHGSRPLHWDSKLACSTCTLISFQHSSISSTVPCSISMWCSSNLFCPFLCSGTSKPPLSQPPRFVSPLQPPRGKHILHSEVHTSYLLFLFHRGRFYATFVSLFWPTPTLPAVPFNNIRILACRTPCLGVTQFSVLHALCSTCSKRPHTARVPTKAPKQHLFSFSPTRTSLTTDHYPFWHSESFHVLSSDTFATVCIAYHHHWSYVLLWAQSFLYLA